MVGQVDKVPRFGAVAGELSCHDGGVGGTETEAHPGVDIAQNGVEHTLAKLRGVLVSEDEAQRVLSELREHVGEGFGGEGVELVDIKEEGSALVRSKQ